MLRFIPAPKRPIGDIYMNNLCFSGQDGKALEPHQSADRIRLLGVVITGINLHHFVA